MRIFALIPCYNEQQRVLSVIRELKKVSAIDKIIVVDDGSTDGSRELLSEEQGIQLICHEKNQGKTRAVETGIAETKAADYVLLIDADLKNFSAEKLNAFFDQVTNTYDMVLFERTSVHVLSRVSMIEAAFTGIRLVKRQIFISHPEIFQVEGFLLEPRLNSILLKQYKVAVYRLDGVSHDLKIQKHGLKGQMRDFNMIKDYVSFLGIVGMCAQLYKIWSLPVLRV